MRAVTLILILGLSFGSMAGTDGELIARWRVVADSLESNIPEGQVKISGKVYQEFYDMVEGRYQKIPVPNAKISNISRTSSTLSDANGNYEFTITDKDTSIYMLKYGWSEVVIYSYKFKSQHHATIDFMPVAVGEMIDITEKPVIYAYSDVDTTLEIGVKQVGEMTFTYPKLNDLWNVQTNTKGDLKVDGRSYPYLFWEAERPTVAFYKKDYVIPGRVVNKEDVITFLEASLTEMGLTSREKTDFITYWGPRMIQNDRSFIQFLVDDQVAPVIGDLEISPKPNNVRRVFVNFIDAEKFNLFAIYATEAQSFQPMERDGITVLEWGGTELKMFGNEAN